ncbi:MAG: bifunctional 5,10-methylenetetrahydrofolate dehydrogenase/5,10-methenyltetrahydrofolate cyclohydrolase [Candidatus Omnitrophota bacterium]|nr:MAG: bifunctional 5,10-methylenetetrahydrofolate dehydrogenase/5,10-methenyltetrahydrofolate cyclohydrolase [Candidatus Omnitrophota bacterium]
MAELLQGKPIADKIKQTVAKDAQNFKNQYGIAPLLCAVQLGNNHAAQLYIKAQKKTAEQLGISYRVYNLSLQTTHNQVVELIKQLNHEKNVHGIILGCPLPKHLNVEKIICYINPCKDVEGIHPENLGNIVLANEAVIPCTACAVMEILQSINIDLYGKEAVIVGHSKIVGKPLALLLLNKFATTTVCHIATAKQGMLIEHIKRAEILLVAVGKPNLVRGIWIKQGAVVVDIGINRVGNKVIGDVEFEEAFKRAAFITPVPGGVGPLTVAILMRNLLKTAKMQSIGKK